MTLMNLPLELFQAILAEAMLARTLRRALRLRLVNRFFSTEVTRMLAELRMLDDCEVQMYECSNVGVDYISQLLLSKQAILSPALDNIRRVASRIALEDVDDNTDNYSKHILALSSLITSQSLAPMRSLFVSSFNAEDYFEHDLLTAAAYLSKISIVQELSERKNVIRQFGTMVNPYTAATLGGDLKTIDHLLQKAEDQGRERALRWSQLSVASEIGSRRTVEHLLTTGWASALENNNVRAWQKFHHALKTPDLETFGVLMRYKRSTPYKTLDTSQLASLLKNAVVKGWEDMTAHLLELGAPTDGDVFELRREGTPLFAACQCGSEGVIRQLLQQKPKLRGREIEKAASRGSLGIVKLLIEYGADVNSGHTPPILSAVQLEHKELFHLLVNHGAVLGGEVGVAAARIVKEEGLDSMLHLLQEYNVEQASKTKSE